MENYGENSSYVESFPVSLFNVSSLGRKCLLYFVKYYNLKKENVSCLNLQNCLLK